MHVECVHDAVWRFVVGDVFSILSKVTGHRSESLKLKGLVLMVKMAVPYLQIEDDTERFCLIIYLLQKDKVLDSNRLLLMIT